MEFILPALWGLQFRHHRILTENEQYYPFVPHSHAILHFCAFWTLVLHYESSCGPFLLNFLIQDPLSHSVLLCEWHIFISIHGRRGSCGHLLLYALRLCLLEFVSNMSCFFQWKWLLRALALFLIHGMGSFIYDKLSHSASSPWV